MVQQKQNNVVLNFKTNGQVQYAQTIKQINMVMSTASKEYQTHILAMGKDADQTAKLAAEKKKLDTQLAASAQKVEMLDKEFKEMQNSTTATVDDLQKLYNQLLAAENAHTKLEQSMKRVGEGLTEEAIASRDAKGELQQYVDEMRRLEAEQKKLSSSFDLQNASLSKTATEAEKASLLQRQYAQQLEHTERYVNNLSTQLDVAKRAYGDNSKEVAQLETKLNAAKTTVAKFNQEIESIGDSARGAEKAIGVLEGAISGLGGVATGISLAKIFEESLNVSDLNSRIDIAFNIDESSKESVRGMLADVQKYGVSAEESFEGLRRQFALNGDVADDVNGKIVEGAAAITKAYNRVDFVELIQEVNEISGELGIADQEALNLVNDLLRIGFPDEQIDTIAEYGQQIKRAGYNAQEIKGIMASAVATDSWNIDNLLDGLKEGRIRAAEMGNGLSEGFKDAITKVTTGTRKMTDEQIAELEKSLSKQEKAKEKSLDAQYKAVEKNLEQQERELNHSLDAELKAHERAADAKIKLIDKEYTERLKLIDEERYRKIKAVEDQIEQIEDLMDAESKAAEEAENARKREDLYFNVISAKNNEDRRAAEKALADFEVELKAKQLNDERKSQIDALKDQKDGIKDLYDEKKEKIQTEYDLAKSKANESIAIERESIKERQQIEKESFAQRKIAYLESVREQHDEELAMYQEMNQKKIDVAKNPVDTSGTVQQLENWGKAIAQGGEAGSKAYEEMVRWLDGIENATLRNTIGTEIFGSKWEDQGENIIDTVLGVDEALVNLEKTTQDTDEMTGKIGKDNGLVNFQDAVQQTKVALDPLFGLLGDVIGAFASFAAEHPKITAFFVAIIGFVGILAGAFVGLAPIIFSITSLFGGGAAGSSLLGVFSKLMPVITNLATKVLPLLGRAFGLISGPIGWIITALTIAVPLIIKHWDSIVEFFKEWGPKILLVLTGPIGLLVKFIVDNWDMIKTKTTEIFGLIYDNTIGRIKKLKDDAITKFKELKDGIISPIRAARDAIKEIIDKIKSFFNFKFEWPELKVPKLEIKKGSLNPLKWFSDGFPEVDIKWHAKGGIMTRPTIFGRSGNELLGGGEAGPEAILPLNDKNLSVIGEAIAATINTGGQNGETVIHLTTELDGAVVAKKTVRYMNRELFKDYQKDMRGAH